MKKISFALVAAASISVPAYSAYYVTGTVKAETCYSFGIRHCSYAEVHATRENGKTLPFPDGFGSVSDYSKSSGTCSIRVGRNIGVQFLTRTMNGSYEEISSPDRITFPCVERH